MKLFNFLGFKTENELINLERLESEVAWPFPNKDTAAITLEGLTMKSLDEEVDPSGRPLNSPGAKADAGKVQPWLMLAGFSNALERVAEVTTEGAKKYTPNGWAEVPDGVNRYMESFGRHMLKLGSGEIYDNGPNGIGTKHKAQMIWNLLASLELEEREKSSS